MLSFIKKLKNSVVSVPAIIDPVVPVSSVHKTTYCDTTNCMVHPGQCTGHRVWSLSLSLI